jgi:hypothetical protein
VDYIELIARSEWPVVAGGAMLLFYRPIKALLAGVSLKKIDAWGVKAEFERGLDEVEKLAPPKEEVKAEEKPRLEFHRQLSEFTTNYFDGLRPFLYENVSPEAVVLDSWSVLEGEMRAMTEALQPTSDKVPLSLNEQAEMLGLTNHEIVSLTVLRRLRNKVAHSGDQSLTWEDATRFKRSIGRLVAQMRSNWERLRKK